MKFSGNLVTIEMVISCPLLKAVRPKIKVKVAYYNYGYESVGRTTFFELVNVTMLLPISVLKRYLHHN